MKMLPYRRKSERICVSSSCQLLLCIRGHLHPKPTLLFYKSSIKELGCSSPPDRVLQVMAKLPSWHCPIKTYWCVPVPESSSPHCRAKWTCPASPGNGGVTGPGAPKPVLGKLHRAWKWQQFSTPMALPGMLTKLAAGQVL